MSPDEVKPYIDMLGGLLGAGGLGAIILAYIGVHKARAEKSEPAKPEPERPSIGSAGMQAIGGALIAESQVDRLTAALTAVALAMTATSEQKRHDAGDERRMAEAAINLGHSFIDELRDLRRALRDLRPDRDRD